MSITQIESLTRGECRWIGREDIHVYCHAPAGRDAAYCIVCPEAGLDYGTWITADEAAVIVDRIVASAVPAAAGTRRAGPGRRNER